MQPFVDFVWRKQQACLEQFHCTFLTGCFGARPLTPRCFGACFPQSSKERREQTVHPADNDVKISSSNMRSKHFFWLVSRTANHQNASKSESSPGKNGSENILVLWPNLWTKQIKQPSKTNIPRLLIEVLISVHRRFASNMRHVESMSPHVESMSRQIQLTYVKFL